ncbi:MAG: radical SAM protein [Chitinophagaceae bacterium]|nr:MAG: radical SAM protein [Chitinophagaceae bacterium]
MKRQLTDMSNTLTLPINSSRSQGEIKHIHNQQTRWVESTIIWLAIKLRILYFAIVELKRPVLIWKTFRTLIQIRNTVWAGDLKKLYRVQGKYYFNQYTPAWPSRAYDDLIRSELRRHADPLNVPERLSFVFLAITRKCPMRCEHCFEWDNLNQREVLTKEILIKTIDMFQEQGVLQMHFSGGEPMVRFKDLVALIQYASHRSECWVLTSGFNFNAENARKLKSAGCKGVVVSIDHFLRSKHDTFRGKQRAFDEAVSAVRSAREAGMVVSLSVCATKEFIEEGAILPYMEFARSLGAHFVQVLEPKNIGHYDNKDVLLAPWHIAELEKAFKVVNHSRRFRSYPTMLYHGYHQRKIGCFSGSRSVYVDSVGDVHACPFCHTKSYNIIELLNKGKDKLPVKENRCPRYESIV